MQKVVAPPPLVWATVKTVDQGDGGIGQGVELYPCVAQGVNQSELLNY